MFFLVNFILTQYVGVVNTAPGRKSWGGWRNSPFCLAFLYVGAACSTPFLWSCPKKRGGAPKKGAWGGGAPVRFRDPPASPTRVGGATRPLRCPLRGRIESLAATARGLGWQKSSPVKVFCPAFLQKSGRGPGAEPWPRAAARGTLLCSQSAGGGKGGTLAGGSPFAGGLSRPQPHVTPWGWRWTKERVVEDADPYDGWETGRVPRDFPGAGHNAGNSENAARMGGVFIRFSRAALLRFFGTRGISRAAARDRGRRPRTPPAFL